MSVYNTEAWLEEAVESILHQDIGFEDNVQIVFVNDGSPDDSESICLSYQQQYPNNIVYVKQKNAGLSGARNTGLKFRQGKYVNFFDPDDVLSLNTLSEVWNFFEDNYKEINFTAIPLEYFEADSGLHPKYELLGNKNRIVNLNMEPFNFILSSASCFYKTQIFEKRSYDTKMYGSEDTLFNCSVYAEEPKFGYVCENQVKYFYRKRSTGDSMVDTAKSTPQSFTSVIYLFEEISKLNLSKSLFDEVIIYEIRARLKNIDQRYFSNKEKYENVLSRYKDFIAELDPKTVLMQSPFVDRKSLKYLLASNLGVNQSLAIDKGFIKWNEDTLFKISKLSIHVKDIKITQDDVTVEIIFQNFNFQQLTPALMTKDGRVYYAETRDSFDSAYDLYYGKLKVCEGGYYKFQIPLGKDNKYTIGIMNVQTLQFIPSKNIRLHTKSPFILNSPKVSINHKDAHLSLMDNRIILENYKHKQQKYNIKTFINNKREFGQLHWLRLLKHTKKFVLINDRPFIARDNGEAMFSYINKHHPETAKITYFVIDKNSSDYTRLKSIGKVVAKGSLKHKYLFLNAMFVMSSHLTSLFYDAFKREERPYYQDQFEYEMVWLQHGITINDIHLAANRLNHLYDKVVVATNFEKEEFLSKRYYLNENRILSTGFPRYDYLENNPSKMLTIMPTWRRYLTGTVLESGTHEETGNFLSSSYFRAYREILMDQRLINKLKEYEYVVNFVLHPGMLPYLKHFKALETKLVKIISPDKTDYRSIFSKSSILITDYSSVLFDFSYLYKPVIFYQFDKALFFEGHYKEGLFSYRKMGPGPVVDSRDMLVDEIVKCMQAGVRLDTNYKKRINDIFIYHDKNNSERLYNELFLKSEGSLHGNKRRAEEPVA